MHDMLKLFQCSWQAILETSQDTGCASTEEGPQQTALIDYCPVSLSRFFKAHNLGTT